MSEHAGHTHEGLFFDQEDISQLSDGCYGGYRLRSIFLDQGDTSSNIVMNNRDRRLEYEAVVAPILEYLNSLPNSKAINIHGSIYTERGTPDVIGCINGRMVAFECKRDESEEPTAIQYWRLGEWFAAGAVVGGVSDVSHVQLILQIMGIIEG